MIETGTKIGARVETLCGLKTPPEAVVIATPEMVRAAIASLAERILPWIEQEPQNPAVLVALLQGGRFYADRLTEALRERSVADFTRNDLKVSTRDDYGNILEKLTVTGNLEALRDRRVLVIDDILDSGLTLRLMREHLDGIAAESKTTVLLQKDPPNISESEFQKRPVADYVGLTFTDFRWFSGAGMEMPGDIEGLTRSSEMIIAYPPLFKS